MSEADLSSYTVSEGREVFLRLSRCRCCGAGWFPPVDHCPTCRSDDLSPTTAPGAAVVYASTVVRVGAAGFDAPYTLAYVDVGDVRVLAHLRTPDGAAVAPGTPVRLTVARIREGPDGDSYVFVPAS
jgi:uncharacterized OB-fold protein